MARSEIVFGGALAFLIGVGAASLGWNIYILGAVALLFILIRFFVPLWQNYPFKSLFIFLIPLFFGFFYYYLYINAEASRENIIFNKNISFNGIVISEPQAGEKVQKFIIKLQPPLSGRVQVITALFPEFNYGDLLGIEGAIEPSRSIREEPTLFFPKIKSLALHKGFWLKEKLLTLKNILTAQFKKFLPPDSAALMSGLTFGVRADFTKDFKNQMALSGTTHLVALSGYNIVILVSAVAAIFGHFLSRRLTFYLTTFIIFLFVLMVGAEASVVRAAIMGFLSLLAGRVGRLYNFRNSVTIVAAIMVLFNPTILFFNIGFQLSFMSLLGIAYLSPVLKKIFRFPDVSEGFLGWRENLTTTLGAQLAVVPLLLQYFGQFSLTSFLANILILTFVPFTMFLGFILAGLGLLFPYLGFWVAWMANLLLTYEIGVIQLFSKLRLQIVSNQLSWIFFFISYSFLIGVILHYSSPKKDLAK
jgi:competence protein ComEC